MQEYQGVVNELGASTTAANGARNNSLTTYPYIEIGGATIKKVKAFPGIRSKLEIAVQSGQPVTVYLQSGYVCGVKMTDGKVFVSSGHPLALDLFGTVFILGFGLLLSAIVVGIPILLWGLWYFWGVWSFRMAKSSLAGSGAVVI